MPTRTVSRRIARLFALATVPGAIGYAAAQPDVPPDWAYAINPPAAPAPSPPPPDATPRHVPGSTAAFTPDQLRDLFDVPDWHPDGHPPMPDIVAHGRGPDVYACSYCHLANGQGRPENASLAGLPAAYIVQQLDEFGSGRRRSSDPRHGPAARMAGVAVHVSAAEAVTAARYFSGLKPRRWIRVVETTTVPRTHVAGWMRVADEGAAAEPIGARIIEMPEDLERTELRDDASGFVAWVPAGSLQRGEALVRGPGAGDAPSCTSCHGADLRGRGDIPSIAGRSPSYVVRQLYDIRHGARTGEAVAPMQAPVACLEPADFVAVAAYLAALPP